VPKHGQGRPRFSRGQVREVLCPRCGAPPGDHCQRQDGDVRMRSHIERAHSREQVFYELRFGQVFGDGLASGPAAAV
jgi:hypothetical protein